jgi:hypothetical protein
MPKLEWVSGEPNLESRPLVDGAELELLMMGGRWLPVRWQSKSLLAQLGGDWETSSATPIECRIDVDLAQVELRRSEAPARATRVMALGKFLESQAATVDASEIEMMRAHKSFLSELPRAIEEYGQRLRDHSFDLFSAAAQFAVQKTDDTRAQLEASAIKFEETSRWLAALQVMQAHQEG